MYRGNRSLSKIWIEEEGGSRAGENESIVSAIDRGSGFLLSAFHQKMALWDAYQVLFFVSFKMNPRILSHRRPRQIHASSIPGTVSLVDRSPFSEGLRDDRNIIERQQRDAFRGILWGGRGKKMPWNGRVSVEFILIISTFFLRRETHLPATEENLLRSFSFFLSFTPPLSISSSSFLLFFSLF